METMPRGNARSRAGRRIVVIVLATLLGAASFWAGRVTTQPAAVPTAMPLTDVVVAVTHSSVGRQLSLNASVDQRLRALAINSLSGVVTSVSGPGLKRPGAVLYRVRQIPVRAVRGSLPFYRSLGRGDRGRDVAQLREALKSLGLLRTAGSRYDLATRNAVKAWQHRLGIPRSGRVGLGELVAVPDLKRPIVLDTKVLVKGAVLSGGEKLVSAVVGDPAISLLVTGDQQRMIPSTADVRITFNGEEWPAKIARTELTQTGETRLVLASSQGGAVCGKSCSPLLQSKARVLPATIQLVKPVSGPAVPVAAILVDAAGVARVTVVPSTGAAEAREVRVLGSQDGVAIVEGLAVGDQVRLFAGTAQSASSEPSR